jgi:hypothetical protein
MKMTLSRLQDEAIRAAKRMKTDPEFIMCNRMQAWMQWVTSSTIQPYFRATNSIGLITDDAVRIKEAFYQEYETL